MPSFSKNLITIDQHLIVENLNLKKAIQYGFDMRIHVINIFPASIRFQKNLNMLKLIFKQQLDFIKPNKDIKTLLQIKKNLKDFVPFNSTFQTAWTKASNTLKKSKSIFGVNYFTWKNYENFGLKLDIAKRGKLNIN
ncbi:hypothetical protein BpHYR1_020049 [Brachionus plicatilis]|uniref:Uncharacterized protein n=1 Tax=Brachionus plicatilis TaxID=10195 RepID=A0A3M7SY42_BRAPC|nr:hypothetical protein BpHYR1_020049 [Brachionus plicatilis]